MKHDEARYKTAPELAKRYRVSLPTIHKWVKLKKLPVAFREGNVIRFNVDDCDTALLTTCNR